MAAASTQRGGLLAGEAHYRPDRDRAFRVDIQALRGIAVLFVVLYHAGMGVRAGFLGVDVFFVISGFLVTGMIRSRLDAGTFTFSEFYLRRARRLLPAAFVAILATVLAAPVFLGLVERAEFARQVVGAVTFTANVVLWRQTGYFGPAAALTPLLHVWSLSLEEQYYIILPATLVFVPVRWRLRVALALLGGSLLLCVLGQFRSPVATFYLLPTRAWELGIGSVAAFYAHHARVQRIALRLVIPAIVALVMIPLFPVSSVNPGPDSLLLCLAAAVVILARHPTLNAAAPARALAKVGDFSYSLYLVHWPLFSLANNAWVGADPQLPVSWRWTLIAASLLLGYGLYRTVEVATRDVPMRLSAGRLAAAAALPCVIIALAIGLTRPKPGTQRIAKLLELNAGLGVACAFEQGFEPRAECSTSENPGMMVWGDSYGMHIVPGIVASSGHKGVSQATRTVCAPFLGLAPITTAAGLASHERAQDCIAFNAAVASYLRRTPSIRVVVVSSILTPYVEPGSEVMEAHGGGTEVVSASVDRALTHLRSTAELVHSLGRRLVIVAPPPTTGFDIARCLERRSFGRFSVGAPPGCLVPLRVYRERHALDFELLRRATTELGIAVFSLDPFLCGPAYCATQWGDTYLYRDVGHLSHDGSALLGERIGLAQRLETLAR